MANRNTSSNHSVLIIFLVLFTFPLWFGLGMGLVGVVFGLFGVIAGIIAGIFGALVWAITLPFRILFHFGDWGWGPSFGGHHSFAIIILIVVATLWVGKKNKESSR
jgi:hypothetical protein